MVHRVRRRAGSEGQQDGPGQWFTCQQQALLASGALTLSRSSPLNASDSVKTWGKQSSEGVFPIEVKTGGQRGGAGTLGVLEVPAKV